MRFPRGDLSEPLIGSFFQFVYYYDGVRLKIGILAANALGKQKAPAEAGAVQPSGRAA
jgi:hypothetical protein